MDIQHLRPPARATTRLIPGGRCSGRGYSREACADASLVPHSDAFVFASSEGSPLNYNNVAKRGLDRAATDAGLTVTGQPKLGFHDLRHTYASHLIRQGIDPVRASRQLGHGRPSVTLDIYAHEFEEARGRDDISEKLSAAFSGIVDARI